MPYTNLTKDRHNRSGVGNTTTFSNLVVDTRETDAYYIDKINKHYAEDDEIIKLLIEPSFNDSKRFRAAFVLARVMGFGDFCCECYAIVVSEFNGGPVTPVELQHTHGRIFGNYRKGVGPYQKFRNALRLFVERGFAYLDEKSSYVFYPKYRLPKDFAKRKFMVIELMEDETSKPIDI